LGLALCILWFRGIGMEKYIIGVDVGGTNVRMGIVTPEGKVLKKVQYTTDVSKGGFVLFERLVSNLKDLIQNNFKESNPLIGIGIGIAGPIDMKRGLIIEPPNLPGLKGFPLRDFIKGKISFPITIENDANAFTLGENWVGAAKGCKHYCGITLGTGVGGGIVVEGEILHGAEGMAGEVGHMVINPEGPLCGCGGRGCLEVYASGTGIRRMALESIEDGKGERILKWSGGDPKKITSEMIFKAAQSGDLTAKKIFNEMGKCLGLGLVNLIHLFNPEKIVIGGKVSQAWDYFIASTMETVQKRAMKGLRENLQIVKTKCGDDAGMLGAAYTAMIAKSQ
jgi:glucokinase